MIGLLGEGAVALAIGVVVTNRRNDRSRLRHSEGYWFVPKLSGLGATPITWQGWAMTIAYAALLWAVIHFLPGVVPKIGVGAALTLFFVVLSWRKTEGGWGWYWGARGD